MHNPLQADEFRAGLIKVPEGCTFLSQSQEMVGNLIKGEYTYQDPIGSKITVTYQVNRDGTDYVERRKIIKGYATDGQEKKITADQIVNQVVTELKPTVITVIKTTVANSKVDIKTYGNLVDVILTQLKPVVTAGKFVIYRVFKIIISSESYFMHPNQIVFTYFKPLTMPWLHPHTIIWMLMS